jgi:hypothetical protein
MLEFPVIHSLDVTIVTAWFLESSYDSDSQVSSERILMVDVIFYGENPPIFVYARNAASDRRRPSARPV